MILLENFGTQEVPAIYVFLDKNCGMLFVDFWVPYFSRMNLNGSGPPRVFTSSYCYCVHMQLLCVNSCCISVLNRFHLNLWKV